MSPRLNPITFALILGSAALMPNVNASGTDVQVESTKAIEFSIAAGTLDTVLNQFAAQANIRIASNGKLTSNKQSLGLKGRYTPEQGLVQILKVHDLSAKRIKVGSYVVEKSKHSSLQTLAKTKVKSEKGTLTEGTGSYTTGSMTSATGLSLSIQETPQTVSVISSELMLDQDLRSLTDVINSAPGIAAQEKDSSRHSFFSRGFEINNYQIDGITIGISPGGEVGESQADTTIYDRIEIVRGATGLLTGAGDPGAAINMVRKRANSAEFTAKASVHMGSWENYGAMLDVSTGLSAEGNVRARVVANFEDGDSYVDLAGNQKSTFYGVISADLSEQTQLHLGASYQNNKPTASTWGGLPTWYTDGTRTNWSRSKTIGADWTQWATENKTYFVNLTHSLSNDWTIQFDYNRFQDDGDLKLLYHWGLVDKASGLGMRPHPYMSEIERIVDDFSMRVNGNFSLFGRDHEVMLGVSDNRQDTLTTSDGNETDTAPLGSFYEWDGSYPEPKWDLPLEVDEDSQVKQQAAFLAANLSLSDAFNTVLGARISNYRVHGENGDDYFEQEEKGVVTPYGGVIYNVNSAHSFYVSYTDIFKPQEEKDRHGNTLDPLVGANYEVGYKASLFDGSLNASLALFKIEQDNFAEEDLEYSTPEETVYVAVKGAQSKGFDAELTGAVNENLEITASYSQFTAEDADGEKFTTKSPRKLVRLFARYHFANSLPELTLAGGVNWQSEYNIDVVNPITRSPERLSQESYALVNLMARYEFSDDLSAQLNIKNAFDKTYYSQIGFFYQHAYGAPRNVSLSLNYKF